MDSTEPEAGSYTAPLISTRGTVTGATLGSSNRNAQRLRRHERDGPTGRAGKPGRGSTGRAALQHQPKGTVHDHRTRGARNTQLP